MSLQTLVTVVEWSGYHARCMPPRRRPKRRRRRAAALTAEEQEAIETFAASNADFKPARGRSRAMVARVRDSYASAFDVISEHTWYVETAVLLPPRPARMPGHDAARHGAVETRHPDWRRPVTHLPDDGRGRLCDRPAREPLRGRLLEARASRSTRWSVVSHLRSRTHSDDSRSPRHDRPVVPHTGFFAAPSRTLAQSARWR